MDFADGIQFTNFEISKINFVIESGCGLFASACSRSGLRARMSLLRYLKKGSGSVLPSPGGFLSRHMPSSSIASANKEVKSVLECRSHKPRGQTSSLLSVDRKREVSKLNVGVVLIIAIREISNHEMNLMSIREIYAPRKLPETMDELSTTCNPKLKLYQDACQRLMLHPYISASRISS